MVLILNLNDRDSGLSAKLHNRLGNDTLADWLVTSAGKSHV